MKIVRNRSFANGDLIIQHAKLPYREKAKLRILKMSNDGKTCMAKVLNPGVLDAPKGFVVKGFSLYTGLNFDIIDTQN